MARETLTRNPESLFWTSPDVRLASSITVPPLAPDPSLVHVLIPESSVYKLLQKNPEAAGMLFKDTTRSRYAQLGLEFYSPQMTCAEILEFPIHDGNIDMVSSVRNFSQRAVKLDEGTGVYKIYIDNDARLVNDELITAFKQEDIVIGGIPGPYEDNDWDYDQDRNGNIVGVKMRIADEKRWIPANQQEKPIHINPEARDFRKEISQYLTEVPDTFSNKLWFGKTKSNLTLRNNTHGILHPLVVGGNSSDNLSTIGAHLNSHVLYPDNTPNWPIILEIISSTAEGQTPEYAHFHFVKAA